VNNRTYIFDFEKQTAYPFIFLPLAREAGTICHSGSTPTVIFLSSFQEQCGKIFQLLAGEPISWPVFDGLQPDDIQNQSQLQCRQRNNRLRTRSRQFKRSFLQPLMINSQAILIPR
jgi:hypothetical protein